MQNALQSHCNWLLSNYVTNARIENYSVCRFYHFHFIFPPATLIEIEQFKFHLKMEYDENGEPPIFYNKIQLFGLQENV